MKNNLLPVLYSFRRCPYAIRARLAIKVSNTQVELREVKLADKPQEMLESSKKGTVPVLLLTDNTVIDESMDIMMWALNKHDPQNWLNNNLSEIKETQRLIELNDHEFKIHLDHYKYAERFPEQTMEYYRKQAEEFLRILEHKLKQTQYLINNTLCLADIAIFPFIRQFAYVDINWFEHSEYKNLQRWLTELLESDLFKSVMKKQANWTTGDPQAIF